MKRFVAAFIVALSALGAPRSVAETSGIAVDHVWARATPKGAATAAGYLTLLNRGTSDDRLLGATSPVAEKIQFHSMTNDHGVMKMEELPAIDLHPGVPATLKPGGIHMMITGLKQQLKEGETFPLTLIFEKAGSVSTTARVGKIGAMSEPDPQAGGGG
jgi:copper(I)-binding protein